MYSRIRGKPDFQPIRPKCVSDSDVFKYRLHIYTEYLKQSQHNFFAASIFVFYVSLSSSFDTCTAVVPHSPATSRSKLTWMLYIEKNILKTV